jgi:RNA recognition motif-containing protein
MNLFVGNLNYTVKEQDLEEFFAQAGEVSSVKIITDKMSGRSKGFGFVEMPNDSEARKAIDTLNGQKVKEREISVSEARPRPAYNDRGNQGNY